MDVENRTDSHVIRRALLSVSDKSGLIEFARQIRRFGVELISTGGTAEALRHAGIEVREVSEVTGFPEMLDGRVKTLHPRIHGGILARRDDRAHLDALRQHDIEPLDLVVINLYPFEATIAREGVSVEEAIEQIDIGGPAMIRSAAKNHASVAVIISPEDYMIVLREMHRTNGALSHVTRQRLAQKAFARTARYDSTIAEYLAGVYLASAFNAANISPQISATRDPDAEILPASLNLQLGKKDDLRYGENPHQRAALYTFENANGLAAAQLLGGKEMSYNNYLDADAAFQLVFDFDETACAIIKHTNPAGVALAETPETAYTRALATDPVSAFGGIVAFNAKLDEATAQRVIEIFTEVVVAPDYDEAALEIFKSKKNLRVLRVARPISDSTLEYRNISGGLLAQTRDTHRLAREQLTTVTKRPPTEREIDDLLFAWTVCKHTKSNAIIYARELQTIGVGAGQMSRVDSVKLGAGRAQIAVKNSALASDAFFPFRDGLDEAAKHGISAVIQPGGSVRDAEVIAAADEHDIAMVFTGVRHFKH